MTKEEEKLRTQKKFRALENFLRMNLGGPKRKPQIIKRVDKKTPKGGNKEGNFVKLYLTHFLVKYFQEHSIEVIVEGVNSSGATQFKNKFFGSKPAIDFLFKSEGLSLFPAPHIIPFPLDTVGEVKYGSLSFRSFATGLGQIIGYLKASQFEASPKIYGYYIFFNTDVGKTVTENDKKFLEELWDKENIFVVII